MKTRISFFIVLFILISTLFPLGSSAADCPESWSVKAPRLEISTNVSDIDGKKGTQQRSYKSSLPSNIESMAGDTFASKSFASFIGTDIVERLKVLGSNSEINATYISSTKSFYQNLNRNGNNLVYGDWLFLFAGPESAWKLRWMGISNDSTLTYRVTISVKGCKDFSIDSNTYTFKDMPTDEMGVDTFFDLFSLYEAYGTKLTFRQIEIAKASLLKNIELIKSSADGEAISFESIDRQISDAINILYVGSSPGGCINVRDGGRSIPPVNAPNAVISSTPCKVAIYGMYPNKGTSGFTLITTVDALRNTKAEAEAKAKAEAEAKAKAKAAKKKTITCIKGKLTKKVTGVNPKCPTGYRKK